MIQWVRYSQTQFLITKMIEKQGKQVVVALVAMFTLREDASVIDTLCKKAVIRFKANEGTFEKLKNT